MFYLKNKKGERNILASQNEKRSKKYLILYEDKYKSSVCKVC
jgi:hypothetical protein